jgi:transposase, IS30 family
MRFSYRMVPEVYQLFWAAMAHGGFIADALEAGTYRKQGTRWLAAAGGVRPRRGRGLKGGCLTLAQREEIALGRARGQSVRSIAAAIGRAPSTVSRELRRNADQLGGYRATTAHALAYARAARPKPAKLVTNLVLRGKVEADLAKKYSPEQIAGRLKVTGRWFRCSPASPAGQGKWALGPRARRSQRSRSMIASVMAAVPTGEPPGGTTS